MKFWITAIFIAGLIYPSLLWLAAQVVASEPPPTAKRIPKITTLHGDRIQDDYFWLREKQNPAVKDYLDAENAYTDAAMKGTGAFQESLYQEMVRRIKETDLSAPYREGDYYYYHRTEQGKQYPIYARKKGTLDAPEQVTLDLNELARNEKFMSRGVYEVSDDGNRLAYSTDNTGFRQYTLFIKDLKTGTLSPEKISNVGTAAWAADNRTFFYVVEDAAKRPYRLYRHSPDAKSDTLVYEEKDETFRLFVGRSRSKAFIFVIAASHTASEWRFLRADQPAAPMQLIAPRGKDHEYDVEHRGDLFYIRSNEGCRNFKVVTAPVSSPQKKNWKVIIPCREEVMVAGIDLFENHSVILEYEDGLSHLRITDLKSGHSNRVSFPEEVYVVLPEVNPEFKTAKFRFTYQSLTSPLSVYEYDMISQDRKLLKRTEVLGGFDASQ